MRLTSNQLICGLCQQLSDTESSRERTTSRFLLLDLCLCVSSQIAHFFSLGIRIVARTWMVSIFFCTFAPIIKMFGTMKQRIYKLLLIYVVLVAIFALQHPVFIACYHSLFRGVGLGGVCAATWHGLRMDMAMAGYLAIVPGLLAAASVWTAGRAMRYAACIYSAVAAAVVSLSFVVDLCLYGYWGFRLDATPVFYFFTSPADAVASVSGWFVVMGLLAAAAYGAGVYWVLQKILTADVPLLPTLRSRIVATAVAIVLTGVLFIPIRGGFTTSTMNLSAAYFSQNQRLNHAAINPLFSFMHSMAHQTDFASQYRFMDNADAERLMEALRDKPVADADSVPRLFTTNRPNVIFIILESFSSHLLPSLGGENVAPNLDAMSREGVTCTNFWGNSFRTDRGLVSIISGYPAQPSTSIMKFAEKVEHLPSIPKAMKREGYDLKYYYGGDANFTNMLAYLVSAGFDKVVSDKDFPLKDRTGKWGAPDHLVFERMLADLKADPNPRRPIFRILQTSSSHEPFEVPFAKFDDKLLNAMAFSDAQIGRLIDRLRESPVWNNLLVVLVADHGYPYPYDLAYNAPLRHRIPMIWLGGALATASRTVDTYASQIDICATLLAQMGLPHDEFDYSKNIFGATPPHKFGYYCFSDGFGVIDADGETVYDNTGETVLFQTGPQSERLEWGKAMLQTTYEDIGRR